MAEQGGRSPPERAKVSLRQWECQRHQKQFPNMTCSHFNNSDSVLFVIALIYGHHVSSALSDHGLKCCDHAEWPVSSVRTSQAGLPGFSECCLHRVMETQGPRYHAGWSFQTARGTGSRFFVTMLVSEVVPHAHHFVLSMPSPQIQPPVGPNSATLSLFPADISLQNINES